MSLSLVTPPTIEPVSLTEAKAHLRVDGSDEDMLIQSIVLTSRLQVEAALGLALITQQWQLRLDSWPAGDIVELPMFPVSSIDEIKVLAADGSQVVVPSSGYVADLSHRPPRIWRTSHFSIPSARPFAGLEIAFTAGFGADPLTVPAPIRHAILLLVAHWFENRDPPLADAIATKVPGAVSELLAPFRTVHL